MPPESPPPAPGRIFISYRREDTAYPAGWLYDRLAEEFGETQVFKDVDSIELGDDFVEVITTAVGSADVLLALIGEDWTTLADEGGKRRLDDPEDFVRLEIEAALARRVRVIPILVDGAKMPRADELPRSLATLARRQALELSPDRFEFDTSKLLKVVRKTLAEVRRRREDAGSPTATIARGPPRAPVEAPAPAHRRPADGRTTRWLKRLRTPRRAIAIAVAAALVTLVIGVVVVVNSDGDSPPAAPDNATIPLVDDFSTEDYGWHTFGDTGSGARYEDGTYRISAERVEDGRSVLASPRTAPSPANIHITVDARRIGGSAAEGYGYGVFCRAEDSANLYAFTIWARHAALEKRVAGRYVGLAEDPRVSSAAQGDSQKELRAVCTTVEGQRAVDLELWVDDEMILRWRDSDNPYEAGRFGVHATMGGNGNAGDTLEVEFDDVEVSED